MAPALSATGRWAAARLASYLTATRAAEAAPSAAELFASAGAKVRGRPLAHGLQFRDFAAVIVAVAAALWPEEQIRAPAGDLTRALRMCAYGLTRPVSSSVARVHPSSCADAVERFVSERMVRSCKRLRDDHFRQSALHVSMLPHLVSIKPATKAVFDERARVCSPPCALSLGGEALALAPPVAGASAALHWLVRSGKELPHLARFTFAVASPDALVRQQRVRRNAASTSHAPCCAQFSASALAAAAHECAPIAAGIAAGRERRAQQ
jgi:hypothetical protein